MTGKGRRLLSGRRDGEVGASEKQECVRGNVRFHTDVDVTGGRRREWYKYVGGEIRNKKIRGNS